MSTVAGVPNNVMEFGVRASGVVADVITGSSHGTMIPFSKLEGWRPCVKTRALFLSRAPGARFFL